MARIVSKARARLAKGVVAALGMAIVAASCGWFSAGRLLCERADRAIGDWIIRYSGGPAERSDIVLLGIDDASLELSMATPEEVAANPVLGRMAERFPWDRRVWAAVIDRLADAGARVIVFDLLFSEPSGDPQEDAEMAAAIARHRDVVVLASVFSRVESVDNRVMLAEPIELFLGENWDTRVGFVTFPVDPIDGVVRGGRFTSTLGLENDGRQRAGESEFNSLAGEVIRKLGKPAPRGEHLLRLATRGATGGAEIYAPQSVASIFIDPIWRQNFANGEFFRDKVVMIGPTAGRFHDVVNTPVGPISGPQLHLQAVACGLENAFMRRVGTPWLSIGLLGMLGIGWSQAIRRPIVGAFGMLGLLAAVAAAVVWLGVARAELVPVTSGVLALVLSWVLAQSYELVTERLEKQRLRHDFRRFVSRDLADALVANPQEWRHASMGVKRPVVVLFSDIRGFTNRAEQADAQDLVRQLNEYLSAMVEIVFRHGGTLDKFIGDAVMAHWGALGGGSDAEHSAKALKAAQEMLAEVIALNEGWRVTGKDPFKIGIGVHLGEVIAGEIGSPQRTEFGVIGDAVNVASRLEGLSKPMGMELIFSMEVMQAAGLSPADALDLGEVAVKGRSAPLRIFGISPTGNSITPANEPTSSATSPTT